MSKGREGRSNARANPPKGQWMDGWMAFERRLWMLAFAMVLSNEIIMSSSHSLWIRYGVPVCMYLYPLSTRTVWSPVVGVWESV